MAGGTPRASKLYGLNDLVFHEPLAEGEGRERKRDKYSIITHSTLN